MDHATDDPARIAELEAALAEATEAIAAEGETRQAFVSLVTHELRVPMTSIKGYTDLLIKGIMGPVSDAQLGFLQTIRANVDRMSKMVSDLSDINRIDGDRVPVSIAEVPLGEVLSEVTGARNLAVDEKALTVSVELRDVTVIADRARLAQVLGYLLDNAIQYTPEGGTITVTATPEDSQRTRISVADTGIGIPADEQARIFEMFFRASDEETRATPGNGLSLHLSRRLLALQNGEIGFDSQRGIGSTFWVTLPAA